MRGSRGRGEGAGSRTVGADLGAGPGGLGKDSARSCVQPLESSLSSSLSFVALTFLRNAAGLFRRMALSSGCLMILPPDQVQMMYFGHFCSSWCVLSRAS